MLHEAALFLGAAVLFVPIFKRLGLGAVLGYLAAGVAIGPAGFGWISDVDSILHASEFGVVLLLFVIGLELRPSRLWALRRTVFGLGGAQMVLSTAALAAAGRGFGLSWSAALIAGFGLALSSTAFVLQMLAERDDLTAAHGRSSFAILLFQDLAVIPFLALVPLIVARELHSGVAPSQPMWQGMLKAAAAIAVLVLGGRYALRPVLRLLAAAGVAEIFTAAALLVVTVSALALDAVGLSMSLGAFLAGVLLADSEYRHELQADIEPFKGLLLGLFFIAVGMSADVGRVLSEPGLVLGLAAGLIAIKALLLYGLGRASGLSPASSRALAAALPQGGEFAFVLFAVALGAGLIDAELQQLLVVVVTVSMVMTPPLYALQARFRPREDAPPFDMIDTPETPVVIAGFGPSGQIIGRVLRVKKIPFTVLEKNWQHVDFVRRFGNPVFYSDATRLEVLRAAHVDAARLLVIAIPDPAVSLQIAENVHRHFPKVKILALARDRQHAMQLMDAGVHFVVRRTYFSSLALTREALILLGESPERAARSIETFREHDERLLSRQFAMHRDQDALVQSARESARELEQLFASDRPENGDPKAAANDAVELTAAGLAGAPVGEQGTPRGD
jgi:monovalent cation:proton antiporter-2 (CPA2) family protein